MIKHIILLSAIIIVGSLDTAVSQRLISNSAVTGTCYAGNKTNRIYIPPPDIFFKKSGTKGGASITVIYSGFPDNARAAVDYAVSILESILPAGTKMTISTSWERITTTGVLANSSITGYASGKSINALNPNAVYPVALAEKIAGKSLNDTTESDINLRINSSANWYYGTDGNTPGLKYDLVTIVLHEVCHGLGFFDSMSTDNVVAWYGDNGVPVIYDTFLENLAGKKLTDTLTYKNYSTPLLSVLTGGNLYFNGPLLSTYSPGTRARIYAPSVFDPGSSISHLDENATRPPNTLMTPYIDMGEAIHNPGDFTMSMLGDLGWINTRIISDTLHDTENHLSNLNLAIRIASDTLYNHDNVRVVFSFNKFATSDTLLMTSPGSDDNYNCTIAIPSYNTEIQYYFYTVDTFRRLYRSPSQTDSVNTVYIGRDTIPPVITHTPLKSFLEKIDTIKFLASASDNLGVDSVYIEYILNGGKANTLGMTSTGNGNFKAFLNAKPLFLKGGDSIQYRIIATDSAKIPNTGILPDAGYYTINFEGLETTVTHYETDFSGDAGADFINDGFDVYKPSGFTHWGLNTKHPYESPEDNNKNIQYTSILRHPLKFGTSGITITYNEVVLVEPGDAGSVFGSANFYDYVIIEGSKNFGKTWFSLADGYDSRLRTPWETLYNNSISGNNSTATGSESLLYRNSLYYKPSSRISAGDTLLVRFRLYSDPFANGWGWIVEDLKINPLIDAAEKLQPDNPVIIYPNPGRGLIRVKTGVSESNSGKQIKYSIYNASGVCIISDYLPGEIENTIDITNHPTGIYTIVFSRDDWIKTIRYSLIR